MRPTQRLADCLSRWWRSLRARYSRFPEVRPHWILLLAATTLLSIFLLDGPLVALFAALAEHDDRLGTEVLGLRKGFLRLLSHRITDAFTVGYLAVWAILLWSYVSLLGGRLRARTAALLERRPWLRPLAPALLPERLRVRAFIGAVLGAGLLQSIACELTKLIAGRERPGDVLLDTGAWANVWHPLRYGGSFPSGHATFGLAMAAIGAAYWPRWRGAWYAVGAAICLARMVLLRHHLSDVLAGGGLGWYIGATVLLAYPVLSESRLAEIAAERRSRRRRKAAPRTGGEEDGASD